MAERSDGAIWKLCYFIDRYDSLQQCIIPFESWRKELNSSNSNELLFSDQDLRRLIVPLIAEQFLIMMLGIVDTVMVASVGEAAISSISMITVFSNLILQLLSALCTGGAVIISQYLGRNDTERACKAATQLVISSILLMILCTALFFAFRIPLLHFVFGSVQADVMTNAQTYWMITIFSFPFLAAYNSSVAIYRSMGNSKAALNISILMNIIHLIGNVFLIYGLKWGVAGAAISTLVSRIIASVIALLSIRRRDLPVFVSDYTKIRLDISVLRSISKIGIPNGIENGTFHMGKLLVQSLAAGLGTAALAANAVLNSISSIVVIAGSAMSLAMITVIGQCVGANQYEQAQYYAKRIMKITLACMAVSNLPLLLTGSFLVKLFNLGAEASVMVHQVLPVMVFANIFLWPSSFVFPNALRAAGDVRITLVISFISMWLIRVGLSYVFVMTLSMGIAGIWYSMFLDWLVRSVFFHMRYKSGKWKSTAIV